MKRRPLPVVNIVDLWEHYGGELVGPDRSEWRKAKCPMHDDRSASASVNEDAGKFSCFTCDEHGDVFDLILRMEESVTGFPDAIAFAEGFVERSDRPVRDVPVRSSLLPGRSRDQRGRGTFVPAWRRL